MPYEDWSWRYPREPVVWKNDKAAADLFEQEMGASDPTLEDLWRHLDEAWERLAHLYEGEV